MSKLVVNQIEAGSDNNFTVEMDSSNNIIVAGSFNMHDQSAFSVPYGTTAQRPSSPQAGMIRVNIETNYLECYNGSGWINILEGFSKPASFGQQTAALGSITNPATSAKQLRDSGNTTNGAYYINLPSIGVKQTYCALDPGFQGGGWMLAWKCTRGSRFDYTTNYWTSTNTYNESDMSRSDADAKYDCFNYYVAENFMAIFPDLNNGGQAGGYGNGWSWYVTGQSSTCLNRFQTNGQLSGNPRGESMFQGSGFSSQGGYQWYGFNYTGNGSNRVRWGFGWNNEGDQGSNDVSGGIAVDRANSSAGDHIWCCQNTTGVNRTIRAEIWVR
tara:strand:+ start:4749 stop:5732 length:984 start_codon:yes stop_codon:yes gene_type:complete